MQNWLRRLHQQRKERRRKPRHRFCKYTVSPNQGRSGVRPQRGRLSTLLSRFPNET